MIARMKMPSLVPRRKALAPVGPPLNVVLEPWVSYGVIALLLFGPLALGEVEPWSVLILEAGTAFLFVLWMIQQTSGGELKIKGSPLFIPMGIFAGLALFQFFSHRTAYRYDTVQALRLYLAYGVLCFLVVQTLQRKTQLKVLATVCCFYGFAVALFALFQGLAPNGKVYWIRSLSQGGAIYGPYVNHNHYAGLMEMLTPIPLALSMTTFAEGPRKTMAVAAAVLMGATIFLSGSRGGMVAFCIQLLLFGVLLAKQQKKKRAILLGLGVYVFLVIGSLVWLGGAELTDRIASITTETGKEFAGGTRLDIDRDSLQMFRMKPVLGWGLGVFPEVYPRFRSFYTNDFINQAHNDYIQLLVEMGGAGFLTMLVFIGIAYFRAGKKLKRWDTDPNGTLAAAAMIGITGILVHSFVDFNLQIPANAALFYVLCTVAALEPRFPVHHRRPHLARSQSTPEMQMQ